jgi:hypothetical protein
MICFWDDISSRPEFREETKIGSHLGSRTKSTTFLVLITAIGLATAFGAQSVQDQKQKDQKDSPVSVRFTDVRQSAGITFLQDSTQTEEKYYPETMGPAWPGLTMTRTV